MRVADRPILLTAAIIRHMKDIRIVSVAERPDLAERAWELTSDGFPEYNNHGDVLNVYWGRLTEERPEFQFHLVGGDDEILAQARSLPVRWDGNVEDLPAGIDGAIGTVRKESCALRSLRKTSPVTPKPIIMVNHIAGSGTGAGEGGGVSPPFPGGTGGPPGGPTGGPPGGRTIGAPGGSSGGPANGSGGIT